jgi:hypothetical protein
MHAAAAVVLLLAATAVTAAQDPEFRSVWKSPEVSQLNFAGRKVAALVITDDLSLQMSGEEALQRELSARKVVASATYRFVPGPELKDAKTARAWYEKSGIEGVVALRPMAVDKITEARTVLLAGYSQDFWGYYGYGWQNVIPIGTKTSTVVVVETLVYDLARGRLIWAATSEARNPKGLQTFIGDLVAGVVRELRREKLVPEDAR